MNLLEKAAQFKDGINILREWLGDGGVPVHPLQAQTRADTCLKCPRHTSHFGIVEAGAAAIKLQVELKNKLQLRVMGEKSLHTCEVCGCAMRLKVWVPIEYIAPDPEERDGFWGQCWLLKES